MSDFYTEQLVKRKASMGTMVAKAALIALTVVSLLSFFLFPLGILFFGIMIVADIFLFRQLDLEFEYLYVNGDLDIDKIMAKQKRKRVFQTNVSELEVIAPTGSAELNAVSPLLYLHNLLNLNFLILH